ncbi:MAG TPA: TIGR03560 family F420-dependent LLM class oxidoreductase [Acidimicrobiales bacterium]|jgi:F420-dependent oxidoreductase-like protein
MRFSIWPAPTRPWNEILELVSHCEATGWDGVYFADHFMPNGPDATPLDGDTLECWSVLAALAASVPRITLAPLVTSVTYRHPAVLAKIATAVDRIGGGRLVLGLGAGWQENEHASYGIELGPIKERMDRFEEAVTIIESMLHHPRTTFEGRFFHVADAPNQPPPVQEHVPLLIGGGGEQRTMRIAARFADQWNSWTTPDALAQKVKVLADRCSEIGRDPAEMHVSTQALLFMSTDTEWLAQRRQADTGQATIVGTPDEVVEIVARYRDAGANELIIPDFTMGSASRRIDTCDLFLEQVASHFR